MKSAKLFFSTLIMVFVIWGCGGDNEVDPKKDTDKNTYDRIDIIKNSLSNFITLEQLIDEGYTLEEFLLADVPVKDLKEYYSVKNLLDEDVPVDEMLEADITVKQLTDEGVTVKDFKDKDINPATLYYADITVSALAEAGYTLGELLAAKIPVSALAEVYTIEELKNQQVSYAELLLAGATVQQLLELGVTLADMHTQNVDPKLLFDDGISVEDLKDCGYMLDDMVGAEIPLTSLIPEYTLTELLDAQVTYSELLENDVHVKKILDLGITISDLQQSNVDPLLLFEDSIGVGTLEKNGYTSAALTTAGLIGTVDDADGNTYKWVKIGEQIWMAENLRTTKFGNNEAINQDYYFIPEENDPEGYSDIYGYYYSYEVFSSSSRNVCPSGWTVPYEEDVDYLIEYLGGADIAGKELKEEGEEHWDKRYTSEEGNKGTNESGFSAFGAGTATKLPFSSKRAVSDFKLNFRIYYFLENPSGSINIERIQMNYNDFNIEKDDNIATSFYSIRCIKE